MARFLELLPWSPRWAITVGAVVGVGGAVLWVSFRPIEMGAALWLGLAVLLLLGAARLLRVRTRIQASRHRRVSDHLDAAANQLQSEKLLARLGAINALEEIASTSTTHQVRTMDVLIGFIREAAVWSEEEPVQEEVSESERGPSLCRPDVERALDVVGRSRESDLRMEGDVVLDLSKIDLRMVGLVETHLEGANLHEAHLEGAELWRAHLEEANLSRVHLDGANLAQAQLENANLEEAHLLGANLQYANLRGARLGRANLSGARLTLAHLEGADLSNAIGLTSSQLREAYLDVNTRIPSYIRDLHREDG